MFVLISAGIAPSLALLSYFYLKDHYKTEPLATVLRSFIFGAMLVFPIMFIQYAFKEEGLIVSVWSQAFILTASIEEFFKWFIFYYMIYRLADFDHPYDGIVYGVSISLGFATVENVLYLLNYGVEFAIGRAILPVSSHALFGVIMGYYFGRAKFTSNRKLFLWISLTVPILLHGIYDYILLQFQKNWLMIMVPFMLYLWLSAMRKVKSANKNEIIIPKTTQEL